MSAENGRAGAERAMENGAAQAAPWWERRAEDVERLIGKYPNSRSAIMGLFWMAQEERGYVSDEDLNWIADKLGLTRGYVDSTITFYSLYHLQPVGKYTIIVCNNVICGLKGSEGLVQELERLLDVKVGGTSADGLFTLQTTGECIAACDGAPALQINQEYFHKVTPERAKLIIERLREGAELEALSEEIGLTKPGAVWEEGD
ncbi:MAG: NAD(P)H-dependent oxidoreductase subunit E [Limnochordales bacterium]|nr:MAG: NAD(P)H-dependent oxidoreductase subunit E [Bacillota bacterium]